MSLEEREIIRGMKCRGKRFRFLRNGNEEPLETSEQGKTMHRAVIFAKFIKEEHISRVGGIGNGLL